MAQHIEMEKMNIPTLTERAKKLKGTRLTKYGSLKWEEVEPNRFIYLRGLKVSEKIVCGGRAEMEAITDKDNIIKEVYFVA